MNTLIQMFSQNYLVLIFVIVALVTFILIRKQKNKEWDEIVKEIKRVEEFFNSPSIATIIDYWSELYIDNDQKKICFCYYLLLDIDYKDISQKLGIQDRSILNGAYQTYVTRIEFIRKKHRKYFFV